MSAATVGVAAELPVVRPPRVGGLDDPAQPEPDRLLADAGDLGATQLDVEVGHAEGFEAEADDTFFRLIGDGDDAEPDADDVDSSDENGDESDATADEADE